MRDADVELKALIKWQKRLEDRIATAEKSQKAHGQRCGKGASHTDARKRHHAHLMRELEKMARDLRLTLEELRLVTNKLLRHGNVLMDAEDQVRPADGLTRR